IWAAAGQGRVCLSVQSDNPLDSWIAKVRARKRGPNMNEQSKELSLDPSDWSAMRALAHRAVDDAIDYLATVRERPVWQPTPEHVIAKLHAPLPREPEGAEQAYADFREWVMPYQMGNTHPRFWSWYMGGGTVFGAIADFLASTVNPNMGGGNHVANYVEGQ